MALPGAVRTAVDLVEMVSCLGHRCPTRRVEAQLDSVAWCWKVSASGIGVVNFVVAVGLSVHVHAEIVHDLSPVGIGDLWPECYGRPMTYSVFPGQHPNTQVEADRVVRY